VKRRAVIHLTQSQNRLSGVEEVSVLKIISLRPLIQIFCVYFKSDHNRLLPDTFQFVIYLSSFIRLCTVRATDSIDKIKKLGNKYARYQASATVQLRLSLLWDVTQFRLVVSVVSVQPTGPFLKGVLELLHSSRWDRGYTETSVTSYHSAPRNTPEEHGLP